jgi:iron complex transport system permease protein
VVALLVLIPVAGGLGAYPIPTGDVISSVAHRIGLGGARLERVPESVLWNVRFPRIVLASPIGASLGCAGALMQGIFGNPLAEPSVIGVSLGAAVGAVATIAFGITFLGTWTVSVFAFVGGLITVFVVYGMARSGGRTEVVTLILTGIAVNAFAGATIGLCIFLAQDTAAVNQITFWQLGSLAQSTWPKVLAVLPCAVIGLAVVPLHARRLDLLALGERPARHLGVDVERLRVVPILVVALLTAAAVSVSGVIGFVGLAVLRAERRRARPGGAGAGARPAGAAGDAGRADGRAGPAASGAGAAGVPGAGAGRGRGGRRPARPGAGGGLRGPGGRAARRADRGGRAARRGLRGGVAVGGVRAAGRGVPASADR